MIARRDSAEPAERRWVPVSD